MIDQLFSKQVVVIQECISAADLTLIPEEAPAVSNAGEKRRREYAAGRSCARRALDRLDIEHFALLNDLDGVPVWPPGIAGSIAHCSDRCIAAVVQQHHARAIGVDIEANDLLPSEVQNLVCFEHERHWIAQQAAPGPVDWHKLYFCAKESAFKALFPITRERFDFWDIAIEFQPASRGFSMFHPALRQIEPIRLAGRYAIAGDHIATGVTAQVADATDDVNQS